MTKQEHQAIEKLIRLSITPSVSHAIVDKLDSADFKLGWQHSHTKVTEMLRFILTASSDELTVFIRSPEK